MCTNVTLPLFQPGGKVPLFLLLLYKRVRRSQNLLPASVSALIVYDFALSDKLNSRLVVLVIDNKDDFEDEPEVHLLDADASSPSSASIAITTGRGLCDPHLTGQGDLRVHHRHAEQGNKDGQQC